MDLVKWGIIGCGDVTEVKSGPAFKLVKNSDLVAVMRRNATKAEDYARRHHVPKWYSNADDLINDPEVNAIYIATPPDAHAALTIKALFAKKPVYVEKPMALNYQQALQMLSASEATETPLFVAYYRRAMPLFLKVKELLQSGIIGNVRMVNIQLFKSFSSAEPFNESPWRVNPEISGGGHFVDLAPHQIDLLHYFFGPVEKVIGIAKNQAMKYKPEDAVSATFVLPGNCIATGTWNFTVPPFLEKDVFEIIGDKGRISFSCFDFVPIELYTLEGTQNFAYPRPPHVEQDLIQSVVEELCGIGKSPCDATSAAHTNWVIDEILKTYYSYKKT